MSDFFTGHSSAEAESDWITAITENEIDGAALRAISERYIGLAERVRAWHMRGYHGRQGNDLQNVGGGVAYGERLDSEYPSFLLQAWGEVCRQVARSVLAYHHMRITRMDYAVSILFGQELARIKDWPLDMPDSAKWRVTRIVPEGGGGGTLYVGSRGSDKFGRVYDKGTQLGTMPERIYWRWEVEYKGQSAKQAFASYMHSEDREETARFIAQEVGGWFKEHGIPFPTLRDCTLGKPIIRYGTRVKCSETTIKWLHQQVAPALRTLDAGGHLADALDALGLYGTDVWLPRSEMTGCGNWGQYDFLKELEDGSPLVTT